MPPPGSGDGGTPAHREPLTPTELARRLEEAGPLLWTVAAGVLGGRNEAEDVLQDAAVIALEKRESFVPGTSFTAWMASIVRNVARNTARKRGRRATHTVEPELLAEREGAAPVPLDALDGPESPPVGSNGQLLPDQAAFDDRTRTALLELAPMQRAALLLKVVLELPYREIAAALGIPEGTAMSHVHRARGALRERLEAAPEPSFEIGRGT